VVLLPKCQLFTFTASASPLAVALSVLSVALSIHFFQVAIVLARVVGGQVSGVVTKTIGGAHVGMLRSDPTIVVGNGLLSNPDLKAAEVASTALIARHLERIADHDWYIAQSVSYMVMGTYIV